MRAIVVALLLAACAEHGESPPDAAPPTCASVCADPVTCDDAGECSCPSPDGRPVRLVCTRTP